LLRLSGLPASAILSFYAITEENMIWHKFNKMRADRRFRYGAVALGAALLLLVTSSSLRAQIGSRFLLNLTGFLDPTGVIQTFNQNGNIDLTGPFFQSIGTNGRSCGTCHQPSDAMGISATNVSLRFDLTLGTDPIFRTNDGSNCDHNINVSTLAGRFNAYSLLRTRGLIRIPLAVPSGADFQVMNVNNPYGCNEADTLSMYRRPLPTTNLKFLSTVMWDGRESSTQTSTTPISSANYPQSLLANLAHQAVDATLIHAQGLQPGLTAQQQQAIVAFETGLFTAQSFDYFAGDLTSQGVNGGPQAVAQQNFFIGINDPVGLDPTNPVPFNFSTNIFNIFSAWQNAFNARRASIARGQTIFNTKTFTITDVAGLNGNTFSNGVTAPASIVSTCGICHDSPNGGDHSVSAPLNIGVADPPGGNNVLNTSYLPVITICQLPSLTNCVKTTDPGRAMVTGKFADVSKFKGPVLRGLAARAPYFHNGSAQTLQDVVTFYNSRFSIGFAAQEESDLIAFLSSL
jgi:cytochrome c peroxidase